MIGLTFHQLTVQSINDTKVFCTCSCGGCIEIQMSDLNIKKNCGFCYLRRTKLSKPKYANRAEMDYPQYELWRKAIYIKDGYKCFACDSKTGIIAHHIEAWNSCPTRRYDETNGITLCKEHHHMFHRLYGYGNNNAAQLEEFLLLYFNRSLTSR